jgi:hypothetical protein
MLFEKNQRKPLYRVPILAFFSHQKRNVRQQWCCGSGDIRIRLLMEIKKLLKRCTAQRSCGLKSHSNEIGIVPI